MESFVIFIVVGWQLVTNQIRFHLAACSWVCLMISGRKDSIDLRSAPSIDLQGEASGLSRGRCRPWWWWWWWWWCDCSMRTALAESERAILVALVRETKIDKWNEWFCNLQTYHQLFACASMISLLGVQLELRKPMIEEEKWICWETKRSSTRSFWSNPRLGINERRQFYPKLTVEYNDRRRSLWSKSYSWQPVERRKWVWSHKQTFI